jgi:F0F1-type ATP synthase assembly protein I
MARRKSNKLESAFIGLALVVGGIGWIISKILDTAGPVIPIVVLCLIFFGVIWYKYSKKQKRLL